VVCWEGKAAISMMWHRNGAAIPRLSVEIMSTMTPINSQYEDSKTKPLLKKKKKKKGGYERRFRSSARIFFTYYFATPRSKRKRLEIYNAPADALSSCILPLFCCARS
jgi:hypothetical protein